MRFQLNLFIREDLDRTVNMRGTTLSTAMLFYGSKDLNFGNK